jgi:hypothetical protein
MQSRRGYANNSVRAMDSHWQQSKVYDVRMTSSGLWTLAVSGKTPQQINDDN